MSSEIKKIYNLLFSVGFSSIGFIAAITVTALAVREVTSNPYLVGIPNALGVGGAFVGTQIFDYLQKRYSRMVALANTFFVGALGGVVCFISLLTNSFNLLIMGAFILGIGQSASLQTRYASSFIVKEEFRATALSLAVWFSVFGSVFGPRLVGQYSDTFNDIFGSELIVAYLIATIGFLLAGICVIGLTDKSSLLRLPVISEHTSTKTKLDIKAKQLTMLLVVNHFVMVIIMAATPLHVQDIGETIKVVGTIISYHTLGMFVFSPILGRFVDKVGSKKVSICGGFILLISCIFALNSEDIILLHLSLFLLGLGWNFNYVSISSEISKYSIEKNTNLNIKSDSFVFVGSVFAQSSLTYTVIGFQGLVIFGTLSAIFLVFNLIRLSSKLLT
jgi:MFS family permease